MAKDKTSVDVKLLSRAYIDTEPPLEKHLPSGPFHAAASAFSVVSTCAGFSESFAFDFIQSACELIAPSN